MHTAEALAGSRAGAPPASGDTRDAGMAIVFRVDGEPMAVRAHQSIRISTAQPLSRMPLLPQQCMGVAAFDGRVVPVLDLADLLDRPPVSTARHDLIHLELAGQPYAFAVDRVLQVVRWSADTWGLWHDAVIPVVDLGQLLAEALSSPRATRHPPSVEVRRKASLPDDAVARAIAAAGTALLVGTAGGNMRLPMSLVVEMNEDLPLVPVPDSRPEIRGAAIHRGQLIACVSLDGLLGLGSGPARRGSASERERPGAWVIVDAAGQRVALRVRRVIGASTAEHDPMIDLEPLLAALLRSAGGQRGGPPPAAQPTAIAVRSRSFLLVQVGEQKCALPLEAARHLHVDCWIARAPAAPGKPGIFVAAVGDRVVPVIPLARLLGLRRQTNTPQWIELALTGGLHLLVAVDRAIGVIRVEDAARIRPPQGSMIDALARHGQDTVWLLSPARIAECTGWKPDEG